MPARPIWRGHLRLALVSCPVALWNARHDRSSIRFNMINPDTGNRIRMVTQDAETGKELGRRDLVKGYEFKKDHYLILKEEDFDSVKVESSSVMTVEKFVDSDSIDPVYYDAAYFLAPDGEAGRDVYAVLREAIAKTGKTALSRVVISQRERTIALRPMGDGLMAHTLYEDRDLNSSQDVRRRGRHQNRSGNGATRRPTRATTGWPIRLRRSGGPLRNPPARDDRCKAQGRRN
jgi:DNA end-binding protein Ku